ncbi:MAG: zinc metallopeptidase [Chitinophagales bacterium]|nr:zinc metallopeptidase [Chitinophagales bacterium]
MAGIYLIAIVFMLLSWAVSYRLKSKFNKYSKEYLTAGLTGKEVAEKMLRDYNITGVSVTSTPGFLSDHYNPANRTVNLSPEVYEGRNIAAAAVAAHECGHAVQHAKAYTWLTMRSALVPVVQVSSTIMPWILLAGIFLLQAFPYLLLIGIVMFAATTLFSFITLPVEFDASRRALAWLEASNIATSKEHSEAKDALWWAAMTYVVAALGSLATLLYYVSIYFARRD